MQLAAWGVAAAPTRLPHLAQLWADCPPPPPGAALYGRLKEYLLTEDQLKENGYPFPHPGRPGGALVFTAEEKKPKDCESRPRGAGLRVGGQHGCGARGGAAP